MAQEHRSIVSHAQEEIPAALLPEVMRDFHFAFSAPRARAESAASGEDAEYRKFGKFDIGGCY